MIRRSLFALSTLSALAAVAAPLAAQEVTDGPSAGDVAAYGALIATPVGATVPRLASAMMFGKPSFGVHADYGQMSEGDLHSRNFVGGVDVPVAGTELSLTAGWNTPGCPSDADCKGSWLAGARWSARVLGTGSASPMRFALGLDANLGYAKPKVAGDESTDYAAWSASVGVPVAVTAKMGNMHIAPYVTPGFGWGRVSASYDGGDSQSESGTRFLMGGGVQLAFPMGLDVNAGMQKVFIDGGRTVWGGGLSWHGI